MTALSPGASPPPVEIAIRMRQPAGNGEQGTGNWKWLVNGRARPVARSPLPQLPSRAPPLNQPHDLPGLRVPADGLLGKHDDLILGDLEDPAGGLHQAHLRVGIRPLDLGGQTGRPWFVVSDDAISDREMHDGVSAGERSSLRHGRTSHRSQANCSCRRPVVRRRPCAPLAASASGGQNPPSFFLLLPESPCCAACSSPASP